MGLIVYLAAIPIRGLTKQWTNRQVLECTDTGAWSLNVPPWLSYMATLVFLVPPMRGLRG